MRNCGKPSQPSINGRRTQAPAPAKAEKPKPVRWALADVAKGAPPFPVPDVQKAEHDPEGTLIKQAAWEIPEKPWEVLYSSQPICGQMLRTVDSRLPSAVYLQVGQDVKDRFLQNHILIPQLSTVKGAHDGSTTWGDTALAVGINEIEFPGGEVVTIPGRMTDKSGAVGAGAHINNHLGKMAVGILFNTALGVGPRIAMGGTSGYHYSPAQEIVREATSNAQQATQDVLRRSFFLKPTLSYNLGDHVCIQLLDNVSFAKPPVVVH